VLPPHLPALDGFRGAAILLVIVFHAQLGMPGSVVLENWALRLGSAGWCGVDLFFVLSGFLITGILLDAKGSPTYFRSFYMRRALRIFPLYFGFLAAGLLLVPLAWPGIVPGMQTLLDNQAWLWCYASNVRCCLLGQWALFNSEWLRLGHFWSLAVEEHYYLFWPLLVCLCSRRGVLLASLGITAGAVALRVVAVFGLNSPITAYQLTVCRMDALAIGGALAALVRCDVSAQSVRRAARLGTILFGGLLLGLVGYRRGLSTDDWVVQTVGYTLLATFFGGLMLCAVTGPSTGLLGLVSRWSVLRFVGKYSYGIYVFHNLPVTWLKHQLPYDRLQGQVGSAFGAYFIHVLVIALASVLLAFGSWHLYEKHFLALKRLFPYR
jgi:peptidoglycan/LPS O-acetylase OafA/YrhL